MTEAEPLPPLGVFLEHARGQMSKRKAAAAAGISEGRWRQIVTGRQKLGGGITVPANPKRETVIAMANAVGADPNVALNLAGFEPMPEAPAVPVGAGIDPELLADLDPVEVAKVEAYIRGIKAGRHE